MRVELLGILGLHSWVVFILDHLVVSLYAMLAAKALFVIMSLKVFVHIGLQEPLCVHVYKRSCNFVNEFLSGIAFVRRLNMFIDCWIACLDGLRH